MDLADLQDAVAQRYREGDVDLGREVLATVLVEEVGELATAARRGDDEALGDEAADVAFLAVCLANLAEADLEPRIRTKYLDRPLEEVSEGWEEGARRAHGAGDGD